ncbi:hypothetical protein Slin15195_G119410 [Septoria linicola]|uniref:Uncharacterized protein n=1 Tax=Septoria linicola TaxID=215465 RepID=A0A9Q9EQB6_9PEZI|nr:hypothetical protein Slin14017_G096400 [Septoria linicola]USW58622.1 hypothetical protein Slin15195_G119410 [Septoria linicola]
MQSTHYEEVDRDGGGPAPDLYKAAPDVFRQNDSMSVYFVELFITASTAANLEADMTKLEDALTMFNIGVHYHRPVSENRCLVAYEGGDALPHLGVLTGRVTAQRLVKMEKEPKPPKKAPANKKDPTPSSKGRGGKRGGRGGGGGGASAVIDIGEQPGRN